MNLIWNNSVEPKNHLFDPAAPDQGDRTLVNFNLYTAVDFGDQPSIDFAREIYIVSSMKRLIPGQDADVTKALI
jgi:hypothetical protein